MRWKLPQLQIVRLAHEISELMATPSIEELAGCSEEKIGEILKCNEDQLLKIAETCLHHYIATNYCGYLKYFDAIWITHDNARKELARDLNYPCVAIRSSWCLSLVYRILFSSLDKFFGNRDNLTLQPLVLKLRFLIIWQQSLVEREHFIQITGLQLIDIIKNLLDGEEKSDFQVQIMLEIAKFHVLFYQYDKAEELVTKCIDVCKLNVDLTGILGKRTRFQQKEIAQLVLTYLNSSDINEEIPECSDIPHVCQLNDDTLLEEVNVNIGEKKKIDGKRFTNIQLACLLWIARIEKMTNFDGSFVHERCAPYIDTVISAKRCWEIQCSAHLLRSDLEKINGRRVERACMQTELIVKLMQGIDDDSSDDVRMSRTKYVLCSGLEPSWAANVQLTALLQSLGCTSEALLILEKLELWNNVIDCYKRMGQMEKAESLIRRLIEQTPNDSMLYVYLGEITETTDYFEKAIEISGDKNARAHRSLGNMLLMRKQFEDAYKHLRRSLEMQPIQLGTWYNAGYCAWKLENFKESAHCYHRCVSLQPDHFEAWNNLSAAYCRNGQKEKAWKLLQEALKYNFEHMNVWENYMYLSMDVGQFGDAIKAYNRLLDGKKRVGDDEVLQILCQELLKRENDTEDDAEKKTENDKTKKEILLLLARILAMQHSLEPKTLRCYAELKRPSALTEDTRTEFEKYLQLLDKSLSAYSNKPNWFKDEAISIDYLELALFIANERMTHAKFISSETSINQAATRSRLSLVSIITRIKKHSSERGVSDKNELLEELLKDAEVLINEYSTLKR